MKALSPAAVPETVLNPLHVLAPVRWSARLKRTGARTVDFEIAYLMEGSWRVLGYISARDQVEEMRALGLL